MTEPAKKRRRIDPYEEDEEFNIDECDDLEDENEMYENIHAVLLEETEDERAYVPLMEIKAKEVTPPHVLMKKLLAEKVAGYLMKANIIVQPATSITTNAGVVIPDYLDGMRYVKELKANMRLKKMYEPYLLKPEESQQQWIVKLRMIKHFDLKVIAKTVCDKCFWDQKFVKYYKASNVKTELIHFMAAVLMQEPTIAEKKDIEWENISGLGLLDDFSEWDFPGLLLGGREFCLPGDIFWMIFSFLPRNRMFLNSIGLIHQSWYCLALRLFDKLTYRGHGQSRHIPLLVLHSCRHLRLYPSTTMKVSEMKYLDAHLPNLQSVKVYGQLEFLLKHNMKFLRQRCVALNASSFRGAIGGIWEHVKGIPSLRSLSVDRICFDSFFQALKSSPETKMSIVSLEKLKFTGMTCLSSTNGGVMAAEQQCPDWFEELTNLRVLKMSTCDGAYSLRWFNSLHLRRLDISFGLDAPMSVIFRKKRFNYDAASGNFDVFSSVESAERLNLPNLEELHFRVNCYIENNASPVVADGEAPPKSLGFYFTKEHLNNKDHFFGNLKGLRKLVFSLRFKYRGWMGTTGEIKEHTKTKITEFLERVCHVVPQKTISEKLQCVKVILSPILYTKSLMNYSYVRFREEWQKSMFSLCKKEELCELHSGSGCFLAARGGHDMNMDHDDKLGLARVETVLVSRVKFTT